ncbi:Gfo/Idh/MocA family oxidoreductase, partial [Pseudomonas aeruginosa]|uniref:Gfo/Idh/MocA family oxidoreductase n=1 Tax=Pseudomonas aeruginosa TaxID=287 RepID=UPI0031B70B30
QRVLIVGAKFGEMYLNAFMQPPEGLELVGLLALGSARSRELAHAFGIPLYTSPEQITRMPDIACIVVRSTVAGRELWMAQGTSERSRPAADPGA